jgi:NAD(P)H-flavin reductase
MDSLLTRFKQTAFVRLYTFWKIPLIWWIRPTILEMGQARTIIKIALGRRTKNHLNSMYFGALAIGAELVIAAKAVQAISENKKRVDFVFKDFKGQFLKRAEGHVHFICDQGAEVEALIKKTIQSGEREEMLFTSYAVVPSKDPNEKIASFELTLSVKYKKK